jgi:hypothetical protein
MPRVYRPAASITVWRTRSGANAPAEPASAIVTAPATAIVSQTVSVRMPGLIASTEPDVVLSPTRNRGGNCCEIVVARDVSAGLLLARGALQQLSGARWRSCCVWAWKRGLRLRNWLNQG